jgi:hypothetical protein
LQKLAVTPREISGLVQAGLLFQPRQYLVAVRVMYEYRVMLNWKLLECIRKSLISIEISATRTWVETLPE